MGHLTFFSYFFTFWDMGRRRYRRFGILMFLKTINCTFKTKLVNITSHCLEFNKIKFDKKSCGRRVFEKRLEVEKRGDGVGQALSSFHAKKNTTSSE